MLPRILCEQLCSLNPNEVSDSDSDSEVSDSDSEVSDNDSEVRWVTVTVKCVKCDSEVGDGDSDSEASDVIVR